MTTENPEFGEIGYRFEVKASAIIISSRENYEELSARRPANYDIQFDVGDYRFVMKDMRKSELIELVAGGNEGAAKEIMQKEKMQRSIESVSKCANSRPNLTESNVARTKK